MVVSKVSTFLLQAPSALAVTKGALVILSTPPAIYNMPSPHIIARLASIILCKPLAHNLFTVFPPTVMGKPANNAAILATSLLSSPA